MKKITFSIFFAVLVFLANAQFTRADLQATGLTCAMCNNSINKALKQVPFVESVKSNVRDATFAIVFKPGAGVDIDALKSAVENAGFSVGGLKLTGNFSGMKISNEQHVQIGDKTFCFLNVNEQTLNGEETIKVVDKNFVTLREFKKISASTKMSCLQTGKSGACCGMDGLPNNTRIYHVTI